MICLSAVVILEVAAAIEPILPIYLKICFRMNILIKFYEISNHIAIELI